MEGSSGRSKWSDERLDDNVGIIHDELRALRELPRSVADLANDVERMATDLNGCYTATRETAAELASYIREERDRLDREREERERKAEQRRLERKSDRRWLVGTGLSSAGLVIAALGLLAGKL